MIPPQLGRDEAYADRSLIDHYHLDGNPRGSLVGVKVFAYWNVHRSLYSLIELRSGRVVDRRKQLRLKDVEFRVRPAGHRQVVTTGVKTVHAGIVGVVTAMRAAKPRGWRRVRYNPFRRPCFTDSRGRCVIAAKDVVLRVEGDAPAVYALGLARE